MRRLRLWVIDQPADVQRAALSHTGDVPTFTAAVDHLQDPAAATAARVGARARQEAKRLPAGRPGPSPARSPGPAATAGNRRR